MRKIIITPGMLLFSLVLITGCAFSQESGIESISEQELREHLTYLASDELQGRATGEPGLDLAAEYLAGQARKMRLKAIDDDGDYRHEYTLVNRSQDFSRSHILIRNKDGTEIKFNRRFYLLNSEPDTIDLSGELVFAGYGIHSEGDGYNDFADIDLKDKIVIIMNGGPTDREGNALLSDRQWYGSRSYRYKIPELDEHKPKAVLIVPDPESGYRSMEDMSRGMTRSLSTARYVKELGNDRSLVSSEYTTSFLFVHRDVVDNLLSGSGKTLAFGCGIIEKVVPRGGLQALVLTPTRELANQVKESLIQFSGNKK